MGKPISEAIAFKRRPMVFKYTYQCPYFNTRDRYLYKKSIATKIFSRWYLELFRGEKLAYSKTKENFMIEIIVSPCASSGNY